MRVLVVVPSFPLEDDLFGHAVAEQLRALLDAHELRIESLTPLSVRRSFSHGLEVFSAGGGRTQRLLSMVSRQGRWSPDVIWGMWADRCGPAALSLGSLLKAPVLVSIMGGEIARLPDIGYGGARTRWGRAKLRWIFRAAQVITVGSRALAQRGVDPRISRALARSTDRRSARGDSGAERPRMDIRSAPPLCDLPRASREGDRAHLQSGSSVAGPRRAG